MSAPVNVLVAGYGNFGSGLLKTLTSPPFIGRIRAFVLVRPASLKEDKKRATIDAFKGMGVRVVEGDIEQSSMEELTRTLQSNAIHTIVSVVGSPQLAQQVRLVEAAQAAGVQRFFPSEFGVDIAAMNPDNPMSQYVQGKKTVRRMLEQSGLAYTLILNCAFSEFLIDTPYFGVDVPTARSPRPPRSAPASARRPSPTSRTPQRWLSSTRPRATRPSTWVRRCRSRRSPARSSS